MNKQNKLQLLGTGTCAYNPDRMSSSVFVGLEEGYFIFDFGRGVSHRLMFDLKFEINDISTIWLSHFHPDHFSDLIPFFHSLSWSKSGWLKNKSTQSTIKIIGPNGLIEMWTKLLELYPSPDLIRYELDPYVKIIELNQKSYNLFNTEFQLAKLPHANNTAIKFNMSNKKIALGGDCPFSAEEISFISGSDIAIIDAGHKSDDEIIQTAVKSQSLQLVLTHIDRNIDVEKLNLKSLSLGYIGEIILGEDLMVLL